VTLASAANRAYARDDMVTFDLLASLSAREQDKAISELPTEALLAILPNPSAAASPGVATASEGPLHAPRSRSRMAVSLRELGLFLVLLYAVGIIAGLVLYGLQLGGVVG